ncbi:hypothetical protein [Deinococcus maricopensis]|uniref:Uncharacterized protein n=1 Tax=Deinococcus maricopensis (strain DSM 21211 / LMG 22137 / NRRL B-23946 / LB-34) TaxID=709986 RepID=E8U9V0_DEIML|nr:hypothetical protein [Deinococcus maricopensis]ADV67839.1 hypothetical protein Deima_2199 [Deinococcus maricopensis DSM 21211]
MNERTRAGARHHIERHFRESVDRDVTGVAAELLQERGDTLHAPIREAHDAATTLLFSRFAYTWDDVVYVYDRPRGRERYLTTKVRLVTALARSGLHRSPDVDTALHAALSALHALWTEWAGHQATTTDALAPAVVEHGVTP